MTAPTLVAKAFTPKDQVFASPCAICGGEELGVARVAIWKDAKGCAQVCKRCVLTFVKCLAFNGKEHKIQWRGRS